MQTDLLDRIKAIHDRHPLTGTPSNALLQLSPDLLIYLLALFRGKPADPHSIPETQWRRLKKELKSQWIGPLIYWRLYQLPEECRPPQFFMDLLHRQTMDWRYRCYLQEGQLREILVSFEAAGIDSLLMGGPALAWTVYPNPTLRPHNDLDLLIRPDQFEYARRVMVRLGYQCKFARFGTFDDFYCEETFDHVKDPRNFSVELHWAVHSFQGRVGSLDVDSLFRRAQTIAFRDLVVTAPCDEDNLLYSALHMIIHHARHIRLLWLYDISLLTEIIWDRGGWDRIIGRASDWGALLALKESLEMARAWTGFNIPKPGVDFDWPEVSELDRTIMKASQALSGNATRLSLLTEDCPTLTARLRRMFRLFFPKPEFIRKTYNVKSDWRLPKFYWRRLMDYWGWLNR